jgi:transposase-like protein
MLPNPRDREGTFAPQLIPKHARRLAGFDDEVPALYGRGLLVREIRSFWRDLQHRGLAPISSAKSPTRSWPR